MYPVDWDSAFFIFVVGWFFASPAILALIWAYVTRNRSVRKKLMLASALLVLFPFLSAGVFAFLTTQCAKGHIDQSFADCGWISDELINSLGFILVYWGLLLGPAAVLGLAALIQEVTGILRARKSSR